MVDLGVVVPVGYGGVALYAVGIILLIMVKGW